MPIITRTYPIIARDGSRQIVTEQVDVPQAQLNQDDLTAKAQAALATAAAFLALARPSGSMSVTQQGQLWDQVTALTKETAALVRLLLGQLDSTSGT